MPRQKTPVVLGNARFTVYVPGCVRLEYARDGKFSEFASLLTNPRPARAVPADIQRSRTALTIKTADFELAYRDNGAVFSPENLTIAHRDIHGRKVVWTPGKKDAGNLGTVTRSLDFWKHCGGPEREPVEGILSTDGGHFVPDEARVYWNTKYDWAKNLSHRVEFDGYFFAYGADFKRALKDFVTVFGPIPMVPRWIFGFWYSRWYAYSDKEFIALAKRYRRERIPIDVMVIDTDWRRGWGGYDWNKEFFPNPRRALRALHKLGLKVTLNDHPGYDNYDALPLDDSKIPKIARLLGPIPHQGQWACDWSNKRAVEVWRKVVLGPVFDDGCDFWWVDGWIKPPFGVTRLGGVYTGGTDCQLWANRHYYELAEEKTGNRGLILSRWGGIGSHRYPVQFSGDTPSEWEMLRHQVEFTARSGNLGAAYWSHDIGGFFDHKPDEELFIRWSQFGAMSPVFRTHSNHGVREPWNYSARATAIFRKQARIRCALAPYFYTLAREAHETGMPLVRPLYLEHSGNDGGAINQRRQYTIGRDLLVVPADGPADKAMGLFRKRAYFPDGRWYALESGDVLFGIDDRAIAIPLEIIPTYAREGAIIPSQKVGHNVGTLPPKEIHFDIFPGRAASRFELYEDDGESRDYLRKSCARTVVTCHRAAHRIVVAIAAPKGSYRGMPKDRRYVVRVRLEPGETVARSEARIGAGKMKTVRIRSTRRILAGEITSGHHFAEVELSSRNERVAITFAL